jgi:tetratricopeptide (TPR) repeat protein
MLGMLAFCFIYLGSLGSIAASAWKTPSAALVWPALSSLLIIILHGLADNLVYDPWGAVLVFFLPGIAYAVARSSSRDNAQGSMDGPGAAGFLKSLRDQRLIIMATAVTCAAILIVLYGYRQPLRAAWYADLGAVRMAQTELAGFPSGKWTDDFQLEELKPAERLFEQALRHDERNRTANHRLGLIALGRREFPTAVSYLENAYQADQRHRGIWKALGYSYVWAGQFDQAMVMLAQIPEASDELTVYIWWWGTQDRKDLAQRAATMVKRLEAFEPLPSLLAPLP